MIVLNPGGLSLGVPTNRRVSKWNEEYVEGGFTASGQQEWVTPNTVLPSDAQVFQILPDGRRIEYRNLNGKWELRNDWEKIIIADQNVLIQKDVLKNLKNDSNPNAANIQRQEAKVRSAEANASKISEEIVKKNIFK